MPADVTRWEKVLDADPTSDRVMLSVQDGGSDLNYVLWDGAAWGTPSQQESDTSEVKNQPFVYLWDEPTQRRVGVFQ